MAVGVSGVATLRVWAPPGVAVTTHDALVPDYARDLERPGFGQVLTAVGKSRQEEEARQAQQALKLAEREAKRRAQEERRRQRQALEQEQQEEQGQGSA